MLRCPNCNNMSVQDDQCTVCGMLATSDIMFNETNILALVHNVRLQMEGLAADQYQQISGMYSSRPGRGDEDGIPFTEPECQMAHRYLVKANILCIRIDSTVKRQTLRTVVVAHNEEAIKKVLRDARRLINHLKGSMRVIRDLSEYDS